MSKDRVTLNKWAKAACDLMAKLAGNEGPISASKRRSMQKMVDQFGSISEAIAASQAGRGQGRKRSIDHDRLLALHAERKTSRQIAEELGCAVSTVDVTLSRLRKKRRAAGLDATEDVSN
jgi:hypothetical protein